MKQLLIRKIFHLVASTAAALGLCATPALAASNVVYVSGSGNDSNACDTVSAPCRTFQAAHGKANAGGEIVVLDSASYGPVTITKSIRADSS